MSYIRFLIVTIWASHIVVAQLVKICLQCRRPRFDPWVGKISWRRERLPTSVFWLGEFHELYSPWGHKESDTTERLSLLLALEGEVARKEFKGSFLSALDVLFLGLGFVNITVFSCENSL